MVVNEEVIAFFAPAPPGWSRPAEEKVTTMATLLTTSAAALAVAALPLGGFIAAGPASAAAAGNGNPAAEYTYVVECGSDDVLNAPRSFDIDCTAKHGAARTYLQNLTWSGWGNATATAKGRFAVERPTTHHEADVRLYPVTVKATNIKRGEANQKYSRLEVTFTKRAPKGFDRTIAFTLDEGKVTREGARGHRHGGHKRHNPDRNRLNSGTYMIECVEDQLREVPTRFTVTCADAKEYLDKLTWKGWGHKQARASGVLTIEPTYAEKQESKGKARAQNYPVTVVADKLVKREANQVYSRMQVTFTGKTAPGEPRTMVIDLPK